jgi:hypothetical protein
VTTERLDRLFSAQTAKATPQQRSAVIRWQGTDRFYEKVQGALGGAGDPDAMAVAQELSNLAQALPEDTKLWRGIRSIGKTFSVSRADIASVAGLEWVADRFTATTINRETATPEFTQPGSTPAILQIAARAGARAV